MKVSFTLDQLNYEFWHTRAVYEALQIQSNAKDKDRDFENDILLQTKRGHAAEVYAIENLDHTDNEADYQDTFDVDGTPVDHKVSVSVEKLELTLEKYVWDLENAWPKRRKNMPHRIYAWINKWDRNIRGFSDYYELHGVYEYNKIMKKLVYISPKVWYNNTNVLKNEMESL